MEEQNISNYSFAGTIPTEIKEELKEMASKRISQLSMLPKKTAKIIEDYLVKNKMEDLLNKLCWFLILALLIFAVSVCSLVSWLSGAPL